MRHQSRSEVRPGNREGPLPGAACLSSWWQGEGGIAFPSSGCGGAVIDGLAWSHMVEGF
jgi:hypothetical protein